MTTKRTGLETNIKDENIVTLEKSVKYTLCTQKEKLLLGLTKKAYLLLGYWTFNKRPDDK